MANTDQTPATIADVVSIVRRYALGATLAFVLLVTASVYSASESSRSADDAQVAATTAAQISSDSRSALVASGKFALVTGCNRDYESQVALLGLLTYLEDRNKESFKDGRTDAKTRADSAEFYRRSLTDVKIPDCRVVENALTADPNVPIPSVKPLHIKNK